MASALREAGGPLGMGWGWCRPPSPEGASGGQRREGTGRTGDELGSNPASSSAFSFGSLGPDSLIPG